MNSLLVVDDDSVFLRLMSRHLAGRLVTRIRTTAFPSEALQLAHQHLFDFVVVDVTMSYHGQPYGGLELCRSLSARYGPASLIAYSQLITDDLVRTYGYEVSFLEKGHEISTFASRLITRMRKARRQQRCFVAMPFNRSLAPLWRTIARAIRKAGFLPVRMDEQVFTADIVERLFREIREAKVVVFVSTGRNANVFFEAGFASALRKEVVTLSDDFDSLPFDVRNNNAIEYGGGLAQLEKRLTRRLHDLTIVPRAR